MTLRQLSSPNTRHVEVYFTLVSCVGPVHLHDWPHTRQLTVHNKCDLNVWFHTPDSSDNMTSLSQVYQPFRRDKRESNYVGGGV